MKMNRTTSAQRLKTFACALTVALVAVVGFAATPQDAWAADDAGINAFPEEIRAYYEPNYFYKDTEGI